MPVNDHDFIEQFERCTLPPEHFDHISHLRIAWLYLHRMPLDEAVRLTCTGLKRYAESLGVYDKFHHTVSEALVRLMAGRIRPAEPFEQFIAANRYLVEDARGVLAEHYSAQQLARPEATVRYVEPDRRPL